MIKLSKKWVDVLAAVPETGMGYQIATVILRDGRRFDQVAIVEGCISEIRKVEGVPFDENQIVEIIVTHEKWDFNAKPKR